MQPYFVLGSDTFRQHLQFADGISHFYAFTPRAKVEHDQYIVPDGCTNFLFAYHKNHVEAHICGPLPETYRFIPELGVSYFGVRLLPGACTILPLQELAGIQTEITSLPVLQPLLDVMYDEQTFEQRVRVFTKAFHSLETGGKENSKRRLFLVVRDRIVAEQGMVKIADLARDCGYSTRYINCTFQENIGMSAKQFSEIVKMQGVLFRIRQNTFSDFTELASTFQYSDQAHFSKVFKRFVQLSPKAYYRLSVDTDYTGRVITC